METKPKILYVEDDESLSFLTKDNLELAGYAVHHVADGNSGLQTFKDADFELCVLDVMLPGMNGFELGKEIRKIDPEIPIIFLTAKSQKENKLEGLRLGADDYITKPFSIEELILKIKIFLKRKHITNVSSNDIIKLGIYTYDHKNLSLNLNGASKNLTQKEGDLLNLLVKHKNNILKRSVILENLWGQDDYFLGRSMDVFISRLRKYLKEDEGIKIENIHGVGFRLNCTTV